MLRTARTSLLPCTLLALGLGGCQPGQDIAPSCFSTSVAGQCVEPAAGLSLRVDCSALPNAVAGANYEFIIPHVPLPPGHRARWEATGLPEGLSIDQGGVLRGRPVNPDTLDNITITLRDLNTQREVTSQCAPMQVYSELQVDLSKTSMGCVSPNDNLAQLVSGGTGEALHCNVPTLDNAAQGCPHGFGNGAMPMGLSVNKDCSISGTIDPNVPQNGTFVWIVELKQSGAQRFIPFCAMHTKSTDHRIQLFEEGKSLDYTKPYLVQYEATSSVRVGSHTDPRIRVTAPCLDQSCNRRGVNVAGTCSPLDYSVENMLSSVGEIRKGTNQVIGLTHGFPLDSGGQKMDALKLDARPWVMSLNTRYCTSAQIGELRSCDVPGALESNITWSVIAWPRDLFPQ